jgi:hypothetical protein
MLDLEKGLPGCRADWGSDVSAEDDAFDAGCGDGEVVLRVERDAGHGAGTGVAKRVEEGPDLLSFLWGR